jgi:NAD(P)-dependent dehydrogenase (short-subunit alcohol dehydrogenase family)
VHQLDVTDENASREFVQRAFDEHKSIGAAVLLVGGFRWAALPKPACRTCTACSGSTSNRVTTWPGRPSCGCSGSGRWPAGTGGARPALDPAAGKGMVAYSLSKSLVFSLADLLNAAGEGKNVFTTVIVPSIIDTPANRASHA